MFAHHTSSAHRFFLVLAAVLPVVVSSVPAAAFVPPASSSVVPNVVTTIDEPTTVVGSGSVWSYLDDGQAPPADWNDPAFDDSGWASGAAELGYGDGDETTVTANNGITTYFRHTFDAPDGIDNLTMSVLRDDGAVIYLNGTEIWRNNLPTGTIDHTTLAPGLINGSDETTWIDVDLPDTVLIDGTNTLAAEIHQNSPSSTDTSFDLTLTGTIIDLTPPDPPTITSPTHPDPTTAYPNQNPTFEWTATDTSGIVDYSWELDQQPSTTPDTTPDGADPTTTYTDIQPGTWHFHIRARNGAGLWSDPAHQPHHHHRHRPHLHV